MSYKQRLELDWVGKDIELHLEPRILVQNEKFSINESDSENMLIKGDNLLTLKSLEMDFANKIQCVYIDPPYNTGSAFEHYDDQLEHSTWLSLMKPRFQILHKLLTKTGLMWVQLDHNEVHYAKVLLDEIFGRENFVTQITYERSGKGGLGQGGAFLTTGEYILVYKKDVLEINEVLNFSPIELKVMKRYNKYFKSEGSKKKVDEFDSKSNGEKVTIFKHEDFEIESVSFKGYEKNKDEIDKSYTEKFDSLFRTFLVQKENAFQHDLISRMDKGGLYSVTYIPSRGKNEGKETTLFYYNKELVGWLRDTAVIQDGSVVKTEKLTNIWIHEDIPKADLANEGGVSFPRGKKPEQLLKRILDISTKPGDWVLDSFLGSGTTAAVAHKMNRKWIGIEMGDHATTHCQKRLESIVKGKDQSGISKDVNWVKGGGFKFYNLAPSLLTKDDRGNWIISDQYNSLQLAEAVCKHEKYKFFPHESIYWKQGYSTNKDFIFITTVFLTSEHIDRIHSQMASDETLLICAKAFKVNKDKYSNITIKKIPQTLLGRCEFGKDDYSLNIKEMIQEELDLN